MTEMKALSDEKFDHLCFLVRSEFARRNADEEPYEILRKWSRDDHRKLMSATHPGIQKNEFVCTITIMERSRTFAFCGSGIRENAKAAKTIAQREASKKALESKYMTASYGEIGEQNFLSTLNILILSFLIESPVTLEELSRMISEWYGKSCPYSKHKMQHLVFTALDNMLAKDHIYREHSISFREDSPFMYLFTGTGRNYLYARATEIRDLAIRSPQHMSEYRARLRNKL